MKVPERVSGIIVMDVDAGAASRAERLGFPLMGLASRVVGLKRLAPAVITGFFSAEMRRDHPETVEASRSVNRNVTVPVGISDIAAFCHIRRCE